MDSSAAPRFVIAGKLTRDYVLLPDGRALLDQPGGSLLYAASGMALWERSIGLVSRVGCNYPGEWLRAAERRGFNCQGIRVLPEEVDQRTFTAYTPAGTAQTDDPVAHFARLGLPFPKDLLDYRPDPQNLDSRTRIAATSPRMNDLPADFLDATAAHICPMDYMAHSLLPSTLRQGHITTLTLDPGPGYMNPTFYDEIPGLISGLTALLVNEEKLRSLFQGRTSDLWAMAEQLAGYGCDLVVIKRGERGQMLFDRHANSRWLIPAYPAQVTDPTGAGDSFCGGFLAGLRQTYEPLQAVLRGSISASFTLEGSGPFYAMEAYSRLAEARLTVLQEMVRPA